MDLLNRMYITLIQFIILVKQRLEGIISRNTAIVTLLGVLKRPYEYQQR